MADRKQGAGLCSGSRAAVHKANYVAGCNLHVVNFPKIFTKGLQYS